MCVKMNGYNKNKETIKDRIKRIATEAGWNVYIEEETEDHICYDFGKYSPAGQDFHVSAELEDMEIERYYECYEDFYEVEANSKEEAEKILEQRL